MSVIPDDDLIELYNRHKIYPYDLEKLLSTMYYADDMNSDTHILRKYYSFLDCLNFRPTHYTVYYFPEFIIFVPIQHMYGCLFEQFQLLLGYNYTARFSDIENLYRFSRILAIQLAENLYNYHIKMINENSIRYKKKIFERTLFQLHQILCL